MAHVVWSVFNCCIGSWNLQESWPWKTSVRKKKCIDRISLILSSSFFFDSDVWAIGVICYFLLCGYTPFERDSNVDEMNAIIRADYTFDEEYWCEVSDHGKLSCGVNEVPSHLSSSFDSQGLYPTLFDHRHRKAHDGTWGFGTPLVGLQPIPNPRFATQRPS